MTTAFVQAAWPFWVELISIQIDPFKHTRSGETQSDRFSLMTFNVAAISGTVTMDSGKAE